MRVGGGGGPCVTEAGKEKLYLFSRRPPVLGSVKTGSPFATNDLKVLIASFVFPIWAGGVLGEVHTHPS